MIYVISMKDKVPVGGLDVNTTSRSANWSKGLSPFFVGPCKLYKQYEAKNLENAWQFSKVYERHIGEDKLPNEEYFKWAEKGWSDSFAHRYPMGRGAVPLYSWFDGEKLSYIEARKKIYIPLYAEAVSKTKAFAQLQEVAKAQDIYLRDFDGYNNKELGMSYDDVIGCETRKMGHAFVLAMLLENKL